jgi:proteic killer suppression protein
LLCLFNKGYSVFRKTEYIIQVTRSIKDRETKKVFERQYSKKFPQDIQKSAHRKLAMIYSAKKLSDLRAPPGNHLEKLKGDRAGQHSIKLNDQWRVCFG